MSILLTVRPFFVSSSLLLPASELYGNLAFIASHMLL